MQDDLWKQMHFLARASLSEVEREYPQDLHEDLYTDFVAYQACLYMLERVLLSDKELSTSYFKIDTREVTHALKNIIYGQTTKPNHSCSTLFREVTELADEILHQLSYRHTCIAEPTDLTNDLKVLIGL
ncbi:hypothetical protein N7513_003233 [Penicillium frequentans]|uniref:Uncharacterized protein n=1 Tax=Penicillium frequentans TaxID=3151616 RepID=A0AAD6G8H1_9EURO|nr:hypothetical protein N7494_013223 [Penicillium glabrum]KAJ5557647.1 hypothetical protein N7513_003233 [Penicillium glabrum]